MSLDTTAIKKIAHLARLAVAEDSIPALKRDLDNILNLVEQMNQEKGNSVTPLAHPMDETQPMRADEVSEINQRDLFLQNAPQAEAGMFIVPQFVESE